MFSENILQQAILSEKYDTKTIQVFYDELLKLDENYNNLLKFDNQISPIVMQIEKINFAKTSKENFLALINDLQYEMYEIDYNSARKYLMIYSDEYLKLKNMFENLLDEIKKENNKHRPAYEIFAEKNNIQIDESFVQIYNELVENLTLMYNFAPEKHSVTMMLLFGIKFSEKIIKLMSSKIKGMQTEYIIADSGAVETTSIDIRRGRRMSKFVILKENIIETFLNDPKSIEKEPLKQNAIKSFKEREEIFLNLESNLKKWYENTDDFTKVTLPILFGLKYHDDIEKLKAFKRKKFSVKKFVNSTINFITWHRYIVMGYNLYNFIDINEEELEKYFLKHENLKQQKHNDEEGNNLNLEYKISGETTEKELNILNSAAKNNEQNFEILHKEFTDNWNKSFVFSHVSYNETFKVKISFGEKTWDGKWCDISWDDQGKPTKIEIDINILEKYQNNKDAMKLFGKFLASLLIVEYDLKSTNNGVNSRVKVGAFRNNLTDLIEFWEDDNNE